ncbi:MAG: hypothetical protein K8R60_05380 [Burkholderiales bacterium]|nr:hypothetical protein [Burkholderiales bacterium]
MFRAAFLLRLPVLAFLLGPLLSACTPVGLLISATTAATDTSVTWDVVKHLHGQLTADDATPCIQLNGVQRALNARCDYTPGSIRRADIARSGLQECPLAVATRDPRLWRALPELLDKGARPEACPGSPLLALAATEPCPDFATASPEVLGAIRTLAESDPRAVRHDVFRMLGCPRARSAGLDTVLVTWLDRGDLDPAKLSFSPLSAADPELLVSRFGRELEVAGHKPETALDGYEGVLPSGYELALRNSHWAAIDWWLYRLPQLANLVPSQRGGLAWVPLQRVLVAGFLQYPGSQRDMVGFLMARGADPAQKLPSDPQKTVASFAAQMKSPMLAVLDPKAARSSSGATVAAMRGATALPSGGAVPR